MQNQNIEVEKFKSSLKENWGGVCLVIPVYNAEKYIDRCLTSIISQTFDDFEVMIVDDGSEDDSPKILDSWAQKDKRIRVIHQNNAGVSSARQKGINSTQTKYITFIDIDDYIDKDYLFVLISEIVKKDVDIVCCDCVEIYEDGRIGDCHTSCSDRIVKDVSDFIDDYLTAKELYAYVVWGKIICRELAAEVEFDNIKIGEDMAYMLKLFDKHPIISLMSYQGYFYMRNGDSATLRYKTKEEQALIAKNNVFYIGKALLKLGKYCNYSANNYYAGLIYHAILVDIKNSSRDIYNENRKFFCDEISAVLKLSGLQIKLKIFLSFYKRFPNLYRYIMSFIKLRYN